ncbi:MAG TPA: response regulator transcription factor [Acidimicrobiales bacterium]|nr:response regulator transcription factor [Acidimicrobiales bacterium]
MIRIAVVDDHVVVREGLLGLLRNCDDMEVVGAAASGTAGVTVVENEDPDVVLMDLSMPGVDGVDATRAITTHHPHSKVVVLTSFSERERILEALDAGAVGYLLKDADPDELIRGIRAAAAGDAPFSPRAAKALLPRSGSSPLDDLTEREREVLTLVATGLANKVIAIKLGISERTVKAHLTSIFTRLNVGDRVQAALWAQRHGLGA